MTQANTDYLLPIPSPVTDRAYSASPTEDSAGNFGDHLSQARTFSADELFHPGNTSQRAETNRYDRDDHKKWSSSDSKPYNSDNSSAPMPSATNDQPAEETVKPEPVAEDAESEANESDETDQTAAAEAAGAGQTTKSDHSKKSETRPDSEVHSDKSEKSKIAAAAKKAAVDAAGRKASANSDNPSNGSVPQGEAKLAASEAELAVVKENLSTTDEDVEEMPIVVDKEVKATKNETLAAKPAKNKPIGKDEAEGDVANGDNADGNQKSPDAAQATNPELAVSTKTENTAKPKAKSDDGESSDEEPRAAVRIDQSAQPTKVDTSQLVGTTPVIAETGANESPQDKDNERASKPVAAKGEPITAALARMTRNSATGSSESAPGNNDLPAVDPSRFLGRVTKAFQTAQERGGKLQLRLSPPELGALRIELNIKDGVMSASLQTENSDARRLLLEHLPALRDRLAEQNIRIDRFDVDVQRDGSEGQTDTRSSQQQQFQQSFDQPPRRQATPPQQPSRPTGPEPIVNLPTIGDAGLNLVV